jgi:hypothetical protein
VTASQRQGRRAQRPSYAVASLAGLTDLRACSLAAELFLHPRTGDDSAAGLGLYAARGATLPAHENGRQNSVAGDAGMAAATVDSDHLFGALEEIDGDLR